jgi:hypothetical protein
MNERLKELAFEAGFTITLCGLFEAEDTNLERFAELVRQDEREACAKLCDEWFAATAGQSIRARGNHEQD